MRVKGRAVPAAVGRDEKMGEYRCYGVILEGRRRGAQRAGIRGSWIVGRGSWMAEAEDLLGCRLLQLSQGWSAGISAWRRCVCSRNARGEPERTAPPAECSGLEMQKCNGSLRSTEKVAA